jgi:predicted negative regulator of RcsB-dependent stress response
MAKRISKKELLKKPDEFITLSARTMTWVKDNYRTAIWIGSGIILLVILYFGYSTYRNRQENLSHDKYFSSLEQTDPSQKLKQLEGIIKDYPRTKGAHLAMVMVGHLYTQKKEYPKAISAYQSALDQGDFPQGVRMMIHGNLAYAYEEKGDYPQAAKGLSEIVQAKETLLKEDAMLSLGRVYQKMGKKEEAKKAYQDFISTFPKSIYATMVKDLLAKL